MRRALLVLSCRCSRSGRRGDGSRRDAQVDVGGNSRLRDPGHGRKRLAHGRRALRRRLAQRRASPSARLRRSADLQPHKASCSGETSSPNDVVCTTRSSAWVADHSTAKTPGATSSSSVVPTWAARPPGRRRSWVNMGGGDDSVRPAFGLRRQANVTGDNRMSPLFRGGKAAPATTRSPAAAATTSLRGDAGNDVIAGGTGDDVLAGGSGNDTITGQGGSDNLIAATGADVLDGGGQSDTLTYEGPRFGDRHAGRRRQRRPLGRGRQRARRRDRHHPGGQRQDHGLLRRRDTRRRRGRSTLKPGTGSDTVRGGAGDGPHRRARGQRGRQGHRHVRQRAGRGDRRPRRLRSRPLSSSSRRRTTPPASASSASPSTTARRASSARAASSSAATAWRALWLGRARARVTCRGRHARRRPAPAQPDAGSRRPTPSARRATGRIRLRLSRAGARRARSRGAITVITRERGVSEKGPRSMSATVRVR